MSKYIMRLDDACEKRDVEKWNRMETLLDQYNIKPLVGVIPYCKDPMMDCYPIDTMFWNRVHSWMAKGWMIAMHGYNHVYGTICGGINPVNPRSEFAGEQLEVQSEKIRLGMEVFWKHGIEPAVFFAPSHTFDLNTLKALRAESNLRIISDTVANDVYTAFGFTFVPQQSGFARKLPFKTITFCYHPNGMSDEAFIGLEEFINTHYQRFISFPADMSKRKKGLIDRMISFAYFARR